MRKSTTTSQINAVLPMISIIKVEYYNKSTYKTSVLDRNTFLENLQFLNESGVLADCVSWKYEKVYDTNGEYMIETGRLNSESDYIVTIWMRVNDGVRSDELEKMLLKEEED